MLYFYFVARLIANSMNESHELSISIEKLVENQLRKKIQIVSSESQSCSLAKYSRYCSILILRITITQDYPMYILYLLEYLHKVLLHFSIIRLSVVRLFCAYQRKIVKSLDYSKHRSLVVIVVVFKTLRRVRLCPVITKRQVTS